MATTLAPHRRQSRMNGDVSVLPPQHRPARQHVPLPNSRLLHQLPSNPSTTASTNPRPTPQPLHTTRRTSQVAHVCNDPPSRTLISAIPTSNLVNTRRTNFAASPAQQESPPLRRLPFHHLLPSRSPEHPVPPLRLLMGSILFLKWASCIVLLVLLFCTLWPYRCHGCVKFHPADLEEVRPTQPGTTTLATTFSTVTTTLPRVDGKWTEWTDWSSCTPSCLESNNTISTRSRYRQCQSPDGSTATNCIGNRVEQTPCTGIPRCPIDGGWSEWRVAEACVPFGDRNDQCTEGSQAIVRACNNPTPQFGGKNCVGNTRHRQSCWVSTGCPISIQPPQDFRILHSNTTLISFTWKRTPYGEVVTGFEVEYWPVLDNSVGARTTHKEPASQTLYNGEYYNVTLALGTNFQSAVKFAIELRSVSLQTRSSSLTKTYRFGSVDGGWSPWSFYTPCSARCNSERGEKTRTRSCNMPTPQLDGQICPGLAKEEISCYGSEMC